VNSGDSHLGAPRRRRARGPVREGVAGGENQGGKRTGRNPGRSIVRRCHPSLQQQPQPAAEPARRPMADQERRTKAPKFNGKDSLDVEFPVSAVGRFGGLVVLLPGVCRGQARADGDEQRRSDRRNSSAFAELCNALEPDDLIRLIREFGAAERVEPAAQAGQPPVITTTQAQPRAAWDRLSAFYVQRQLGARIIIDREITSTAHGFR